MLRGKLVEENDERYGPPSRGEQLDVPRGRCRFRNEASRSALEYGGRSHLTADTRLRSSPPEKSAIERKFAETRKTMDVAEKRVSQACLRAPTKMGPLAYIVAESGLGMR